MMKRFLILLTMLCLGCLTYAQTNEDSVKAVINKMFLAMKDADTAMLQSCFSESMVLQTVNQSRDGKVTVQTEPASSFIASIKMLKPGDADERVVFETVKIDGPLAIAWTPYKFYYKGSFFHCGVNSFQLVRFGGEWKVQYIIDTRRRQGCE